MVASESRGTYHWVMLSFSFIIAFQLHLLLFATAPMVTLVMHELGLSHADFGLIYSAAMMSLILFRIPWGLIGDRFGYLDALRVALPISAASAVIRAFSSNYITLLTSQFFLGLGLAAVMPCLPLLIKQWSSGRSAGFSTGIYVSGFAVGNATALGLTPHLLQVTDWRGVLLAYSVFATVVCLLWWAFARSAVRMTSEFQLIHFSSALKDRYVWVLLLFMIASMGGYDTLATWMPKVLEMKDMDKTFASLLPLGFFLAGPIVGFASDRFQNKRSVLVLLGAFAAFSIAGINYAPFPLLLLCIFLSGFTVIGVLTIALAVPAEHERLSASVGGIVGFISSLGNVGPLVLPVVFGYLIDATGTFQASVLCVAVLAGVTFILGSQVSD